MSGAVGQTKREWISHRISLAISAARVPGPRRLRILRLRYKRGDETDPEESHYPREDEGKRDNSTGIRTNSSSPEAPSCGRSPQQNRQGKKKNRARNGASDGSLPKHYENITM